MHRDGQYRGVIYRVEAFPASGGTYVGRYQLIDAAGARDDAADHALLGGGSTTNDAFGDAFDAGADALGAGQPVSASPGDAASPRAGAADVVHPTVEQGWATENEALTYATEAACHAIEIIQLGRPQAQGRGSGSSWRRTETLGQ